MPKVSVILPAYNAQGTIQKAIQSILQQTFSDLELIVIDDGSTDASLDQVQSFRDRRLVVLAQTHAGVAPAFNSGLANANGEFIARMDADDFSHPTRLEKQMALLQRECLDAVGCCVRIFNRSGEPIASWARYERWINQESLSPSQILAYRFVELPIVNPTLFARRIYFGEGYRQNDFPEDYDLFLSAANQGLKIGKTGEVLLDWIDHPHRVTRMHDRYSAAAFVSCKQQHLLEGPLKNVETIDFWGAGQTGKKWLRWARERGISVRRCFDVNPRKIGESIHGVRVEHPDQMESRSHCAKEERPAPQMLIAVGAEGARPLIANHLVAKGYRVGLDALFVA